MRIVAIDPGPTESAYCVLTNSVIEKFGKLPNNEILDKVCWLKAPGEELVIEQIASYGMAVGEEVFETVFWSGRFAQAWTGQFHRIKRHTIKMHLCHDSRAKDCNIRQALIDRYGKPGTNKNKGVTYGISGDCWSALAVATTFSDTYKEIQPSEIL